MILLWIFTIILLKNHTLSLTTYTVIYHIVMSMLFFHFFYLLYMKIIILITLLHLYNITNTYMKNMLFMSTSSFSHEIWSSQAHRGADNYNVFIMVLSKYIEDAERKKPYRLSTQNTLANGFF